MRTVRASRFQPRRIGEFDATLPDCGQVAGRIDDVLPAREIIERTVREVERVVTALSSRHLDRSMG